MVDNQAENRPQNPTEGGNNPPPEIPVFTPLRSIVDVTTLPPEVQKIAEAQEAVWNVTRPSPSRPGDATALDHEKAINTIAEALIPREQKERLLQAAIQNRRFAEMQELTKRLQQKAREDEQDKGFKTFSAQYLTPEERQGIREGGPQYWEELYNQVLFMLTADPNADVIRDQGLSSKISALQEYVTTEGAKWFEDRGFSPSAAEQQARGIVRNMHIETNEVIDAHNIFRAILGAASVEDTTKAMMFVSTAQYDRLSGRSLVDNPMKQRIVADANRVYEQAAIAQVTKKYRRHKLLEEKQKAEGSLSEAERKELEGGYILEFKDLIPMGSLWTNIRAKHHKQHVWTSVFQRAEEQRAAGTTIDVRTAAKNLVEKSLEDWQRVKDIMREENLFEAQAVEKFREKYGADPTSFSTADEALFYTLQQEMTQRGLNQEEATIDLVIGYSEDEKELLKHIDDGQYYSPVEQSVFTELIGSERVRLMEEIQRRKGRGELQDPTEEKRWIEQEMSKRKNYIRIAIVNARQHMYFSAHLQKINATIGSLPSADEGHLQGLTCEFLLRSFNPEVMMHQRFWDYGQPVVREVASLTYLMFFRDHYGEELRMKDLTEWKKKIDEAVAYSDEKGQPNAREGYKDMLKYLQDELGIPYGMLFTSQFIPAGGVYDPGGGWKDKLSHHEMAQQLLEVTKRSGPINAANRFEHSLGLQFDIAKDLNDDEVSRAADGFKTLKLLMASIKREHNLISSTKGDRSAVSNTAFEYASTRLVSKAHGKTSTAEDAVHAIDHMDHLIHDHEVALSSHDASRIAETAKAVRELYKDEHFKKVHDELIVERKKHILRTISNRLPTFVAQYFPEDVQVMVKNKLEGVSNEKREDVWEKMQHALYAVQNDLVRHEVVNGDVDKYFGKEETGFATYDKYLRQFLGNDYAQYGTACHEIAQNMRSFFIDMEQGAAGRASRMKKLNDADRKLIGMAQFEKVARFARPSTLLADRQWESTQFGLAGGPAVVKRRFTEIAEMGQVGSGLDGIFTSIHHSEPQKILEQLKGITSIFAGVEDAPSAALRAKSLIESWVEMVKAPELLENIPEAEGILRMFMGHDNEAFREFALQHGSRLVKITKDHHDPIFQKNELRQFLDLTWSVDSFLQQPEIIEGLYEHFNVQNKDIQKYQFRRILPYVVFAIVALMAIQGWTVLQQGEEEG